MKDGWRGIGTRSAARRTGVCMEMAFLVGRIIVGLYYINSGIRHFTHLNMMAGYAGSKGVPFPKLGGTEGSALPSMSPPKRNMKSFRWSMTSLPVAMIVLVSFGP